MLPLVRLAFVLFVTTLLQVNIHVSITPDQTINANLRFNLLPDVSWFSAIYSRSDSGSLKFADLPLQPQQWQKWLTDNVHVSQNVWIHAINADGIKEVISLQSPYLMGLRSDLSGLIWAAHATDINRLTADAIIEHSPEMLHGEQSILREDAYLYHFQHNPTHWLLQIKLRLALINAVPRGHILFRAFHSANDHIQSLDLYQGSRLLLALRNIISEHIVDARRPYVQMAKLIPRDLVQVADLDAVQVHSAVFKMQRSIQLLVRLGQNDAEAILVSDFIKIMLRHSSPAVRDTMKAARAGVGSHAQRSLFSLQASLLAYMPTQSMDESPTVHFILPDKQLYSHEEAQVHRAAP